MTEDMQFSKRQKEVLELLKQGKSNKQIALTLSISARTVEEHLKRIYAVLHVSTGKEALAQLGKSTIGKNNPRGYVRKKQAWKHEREARSPDEHTVGYTISRSNALRQEVHGLFGATQAWPAQPGFVKYDNIHIPETSRLFIKLRYSKYSPVGIPILIHLDQESEPRASLLPEDQGSWNTFTWTEWIPLGKVRRGIHSITLYTEGQEYGVADLDKFILTTEAP